MYKRQLLFLLLLCVQDNFDQMIEFQSSGPSHILVLSKGDFGENIIEEWLEVIGPPNVAEAQESAATRCLCLSVCCSAVALIRSVTSILHATLPPQNHL